MRKDGFGISLGAIGLMLWAMALLILWFVQGAARAVTRRGAARPDDRTLFGQAMASGPLSAKNHKAAGHA